MSQKLRPVGVALLLAAACLAWSASADTSLLLRIGWESIYRPGRWTPIYITLADPTPRQVNLEMSSPHDGIFAMEVRQSFTIGPEERTFPIFCPTTYDLDQLTVTIRDASTNKLLVRSVRDVLDAPTTLQGQAIRPNDRLIGVSGRKSALNVLRRTSGASGVYVAYLEPSLLPEAPVGYDTLDLLVMSQPDLNRLTAEQQQAIANWVWAGGSLLMWPGDAPVPPSGPLLRILPARIGEIQAIELPPSVREKLKLGERFAHLRGRALAPLPDAKSFSLFGDGSIVVGLIRTVGFGRTILLPIDPSEFFYDRSPQAGVFWRPILAQAGISISEKDDVDGNGVNAYWTDDYRSVNAIRSNIELMGSIPGVGSFDFSYVAIVLIGLMLIVGPIDWIILRRLGRQPWTWATTTGWIALVTIGAIYIGYLFKSGELHYRTLSVIDQADGRSVATTDLVCIYSPKTQIYDLKGEPETWWQPIGDMMYYRTGGMHTDLPFHQDYQGNRPIGVPIPVWNLRFLRGDTLAPGPAILDAELRIDPTSNRLKGSITNHSDSPLEEIQVASGKGRYTARGLVIFPGATNEVNLQLGPPSQASASSPENSTPYYYGNRNEPAIDESKLYDVVSGLASRRSDAAQEALSAGGRVCIYAKTQDAKPTVALANAPRAIEKHWRIVRALVPVK